MEYKRFRTLQQRPLRHSHYYSTFLLQCFSASSVRCIPPAMLSGVKWPLSRCQKKGNMKMLMKGEGEKERKNRLLLARVSSDTGDDARQKGDDRNRKEQEEKARHRGGERRKRDSEHKEEHRVKRGGRGEKI